MASDILVRETTEHDDVAVGAVLSASYPNLMRGAYDAAVLDVVLPLMTRANSGLLSSGTYYLAEDMGGNPIGCGGWTLARPGSGDVVPALGHIRHFATHPDWARRGIGRAIFARCEECARPSGITQFECYASLNAEQFYSALGFTSRRRIDVEMVPGTLFPAILMARKI